MSNRFLRALPLAALLCALCLGFGGCNNATPEGSSPTPSTPSYSSTPSDSTDGKDGSEVGSTGSNINSGDEELPDDSTAGDSSNGGGNGGGIELPDQPF